jgi:HK97 family phage portal protein
MQLFPRLSPKAQWKPQTEKEFLSGGTIAPSLAGVNVSEGMAMTYSALFACVRVRAETLSQISLHLYRPTKGGVEKAVDDWRYRLVHDKPNDEMTSVQWRQATSGHHDTWGNGYCWLDNPETGRNAGKVQSIYPLLPERVRPFRDDQNRLQYKYTRRKADGTTEELTYPARNILHIRSMSHDGIVGMSPVAMARQAIGLGLAVEEFGARYFGQGTHVGAVMSYPKEVTLEQARQIEPGLKADYAGLSQSHGLMVVGAGATFTPIAIPLEDAQFLLTRKFQLEEMARIYRVPLHLIANLDKATFSNIEQQALEFAMYTMTPYCKAWEQELDLKLLTEAERQAGWHFEFDLNSLMRGDAKSRGEFYKIMRETGAFSPNEIRAKENENPREGGDEYWDEGPSGQGGKKETPKPVEEPLESRLRPVLREATARLARREQHDILGEAEKRTKRADTEGFSQWLSAFFVEHQTFVTKALGPYFEALGLPNEAETAAKGRVNALKAALFGLRPDETEAIQAALEGVSA